MSMTALAPSPRTIVRGKHAALARAIEISGAEPGTSEDSLRRDYGVRIERVSAEIARSVGL
jgi:hypothetical protein